MTEILLFWIPLEERSQLSAVVFSGFLAGPAVAYPLCGFLAKHYGWEATFYTTGNYINRNYPIKYFGNLYSKSHCLNRCTFARMVHHLVDFGTKDTINRQI